MSHLNYCSNTCLSLQLLQAFNGRQIGLGQLIVLVKVLATQTQTTWRHVPGPPSRTTTSLFMSQPPTQRRQERQRFCRQNRDGKTSSKQCEISATTLQRAVGRRLPQGGQERTAHSTPRSGTTHYPTLWQHCRHQTTIPSLEQPSMIGTRHVSNVGCQEVRMSSITITVANLTESCQSKTELTPFTALSVAWITRSRLPTAAKSCLQAALSSTSGRWMGSSLLSTSRWKQWWGPGSGTSPWCSRRGTGTRRNQWMW